MRATGKQQPGPTHDVVIVGAGIVGLATAHKLQQAGLRVTLVDRSGIALETSSGNAAALAFSDIIPMAGKGMLAKVPKWLMDPLGPLSIRPGYFPRILPWLIRYWQAGRPDRVDASIATQAGLMRIAEAEMAALVAACKLERMIIKDGSLELYESEAELAAAQWMWDRRKKAGIAFEHVRKERLSELQPGLSPVIVAATFVPSWQSVAEPYNFASAIGDHVLARGATFIKAEVTDIRPQEAGASLVLADGRTLAAQFVVLAAGAWSKPMAMALGDNVPLETERGYNTTLPPGAFDLKRQLIFGGHGFVVSALSTGIRVGGAVEFGGLSLPPNYQRSSAMLEKAARFMPGLKTHGGTQWMGYRPSLPDSLPVIGPSRASRHIIYAFGNGHLGLTQSAGTGKLVADLVTGETPQIDLAQFSAQRF